MIKGYCRTNLDDAKHHKWPQVFASVPLIGERVKAILERDQDSRCSHLKVCGISHFVEFVEGMGEDCRENYKGELVRGRWEPRIEVELNK